MICKQNYNHRRFSNDYVYICSLFPSFEQTFAFINYNSLITLTRMNYRNRRPNNHRGARFHCLITTLKYYFFRRIQHFWAFMDYGCSNNFRVFVCSLYLPRYDSVTMTTSGPCKETCNRARSRCRKTMKQARSRWPRNFRLENLRIGYIN